MQVSYTVRMRSGKEGGGKGPLIQVEKSGTLGTVNDQTLFVCYVICSEGSNSMKSSNPYSGIYETETSPTIDTTEQSPAKRQGGMAVVVYEAHRQDGRFNECKEVTPTLDAHMGTGGGNVPLTFGKISRARGKDGLGERWDEIKVASTRNAMDVGDTRTQEAVVDVAQVRRLTLIECERLQGFSDNYTQIPYRGKPAEACPDAPRYKAIGNSWAVPVVRWIGKRIDAYLEGKDF